jgi:hypothetical protein
MQMVAVKTLLRSALTLSPVQIHRRRGALACAAVLALVVAVVAMPNTAREVLTKAAGEQRAFAVVDGAEQPIRVGTVLGQGKLVGTGEEPYCELPETTYGLSGRSNGVGSISLQVTNDCQLVVSSIEDSSRRRGTAASESDSMHDYPTDPSQPATVRTFVTRGPDDD